MSSPTIFVINDNTRAYPAYVITYEAPNDRQFYASVPKAPTAAAAAKAAAAAAAKATATAAAAKAAAAAAFAAATAAAAKALAPRALQKNARTPRACGPSPPLGTQNVGAAAEGAGRGAAATPTPTASSADLKDKNNAELRKRGLQESTGRKQKRQRSDINGRADSTSVSSAGDGCNAVGGADIHGGVAIFRRREKGAFSNDVIVIDD